VPRPAPSGRRAVHPMPSTLQLAAAAQWPNLSPMSLAQRWAATIAPLASAPASDLWQAIVTRYREPHRAYHTLHHIEACFHEFDAFSMKSGKALELALFFHDVIYDPRAPDNEAASARFAAEKLAAIGVDQPLIQDVERLILVTKHAAAPSRDDERLLVDIDLSILGTETRTFDVYEREVRSEYDFVPEEAFRAGRAHILESFLARAAIFTTAPFHERYEAHARRNLERSVARLRQTASATA